jgi:hypothetical protein
MMRSVMALLLSSVLFVRSGLAQNDVPEAFLSTLNPQPLVGELIELNLTAVLPPNATILEWPEHTAARWDPFEVRQVDEPKLMDAEENIYNQRLVVVLWKPGMYQTPEFVLPYEQASVAGQLLVPPLTLSIPSVLTNETDPQLRPLKPTVSIPHLPLPITAGGVFSLLTVAFLFVRYSRQRLSRHQTPRADTGIQRLRSLMRELEQMKRSVQSPEAICETTTHHLRTFLQEQYAVDAHEMTSTEVLSVLRSRLPETQLQHLHFLLHQADLLRFAPQDKPDAQVARKYLEITTSWMRSAMRSVSRGEAM